MPFIQGAFAGYPALDRGGGAFEMIEYDMVLLESRKETENKLRWDAQLTDAVFSLYIPKEQVPDPWPGRIRVRVEPLEGRRPERSPSRVPSSRSGATGLGPHDLEAHLA